MVIQGPNESSQLSNSTANNLCSFGHTHKNTEINLELCAERIMPSLELNFITYNMLPIMLLSNYF